MTDDKIACAELIQSLGLRARPGPLGRSRRDLPSRRRDRGVVVSRALSEFVAHCRRNFGRGSVAKHQLWPARVAVNGARATAETNVAILVRQTIEGVEVDLTSNGRFLDRLEQRDGAWRMVERAGALREGPARSGRAVGKIRRADGEADAAKYPAPYRYMAYRVHAAGRSLAEPVHYDRRAETEALKTRYAEWLKGREPRLKRTLAAD